MAATNQRCDRLLRALDECARRHPRQPAVCAHLHAAAGWCLFREGCPAEVADVEACARVPAGAAGAGPPAVPRRCQPQALRLEACLAVSGAAPPGRGASGGGAGGTKRR
jgi:hypothetical protein